MKTAEEILIEFGCPDVPFDENVTMYHPAILSAMEEYANARVGEAMRCQSSPKIKQLEWEEYENRLGRKSYLSKTPFSSYDVADGGDHFTMFSPDKRLRFASADKAKAAAQADFEKRIKECLE